MCDRQTPPLSLLNVCSTRQRYGTKGCTGDRLRADELEEAYLITRRALQRFFNYSLDAADEAHRLTEADSHQFDEELAAVRAELRKKESAIEWYMGAFETGAVTEGQFGERVRHLGEQAAALRAREARLLAAASAEDEPFPTPDEISGLRQESGRLQHATLRRRFART